MRRWAAPVGLTRGPVADDRGDTIPAVALAVVVAMLAVLSGSGPLGAGNPLRAGMAVLLSSYAATTGLIGASWWQAAVALSTVDTYAQLTGDRTYDAVITSAFALNADGDFENESNDDTAWWALAWVS